MGRAVGFFMIFLGLLGLGAALIDGPLIEAFWASWTDETTEAAEDEITSAEKTVGAEGASSKPAYQSAEREESTAQDGVAVITELETANVSVFERDNQTPPKSLPWVDVSPSNDAVSEDSGHVNFVLTLSEPVESPIIIIFSTVDGSAQSDEDYLGKRGTVTFNPGIVSAEVRTPLVDDDIKEGDEQFTLVLNGDPGTVNLKSRRALAIIKDND